MNAAELTCVVSIRVPRDAAGWSDWQILCDQIDSGLVAFARGLADGQNYRASVAAVTQVCRDSRSVRRGRVVFGVLLDVIQMCRHSAGEMLTEAMAQVEIAANAHEALEQLSGVHPGHPKIAAMNRAKAEAEKLYRRSLTYTNAATMLSMIAAAVSL